MLPVQVVLPVFVLTLCGTLGLIQTTAYAEPPPVPVIRVAAAHVEAARKEARALDEADGGTTARRSAAPRRGDSRPKVEPIGESAGTIQDADVSRAASEVQARINQSGTSTRSLAVAVRAQSFDEVRALLKSHGFPAAQLREAKLSVVDRTDGSGPEKKIKVTVNGSCCPLTIVVTIEFAAVQESPASGGSAGDVEIPRLDPRTERSGELSREEMARFGGSNAREAATFGISLADGARHLFRVSQTEGGAALIEGIGPDGQRKSIIIAVGDAPLPHFEKRQQKSGRGQSATAWFNSFWNCFDIQMNNRVGHNWWLQIASNYVKCWHTANQKPKWWQKINAFFSCIWNGPNKNHAIAAFWACR